VKTRLLLFACLSLAIASIDAAAFVFSDGTTAVCTARDRTVVEIDAPAGSKVVQLGYTGITERVGSGYQIQWNARKLGQLPPAVHDLIFFHECAHAQIPTTDELRANCAGLKAMRAAGRAGFAVESRLAAFYGPGNEYWDKTLKCANAEPVPLPSRADP
jgi:hypothetical protein